MSRVSQGQRERMAVAQGIAARRIDETTKAHVSLNPFRNYSRQLARSWDYGYGWAWLERVASIPLSVWKPGLGTVRRRKPVEENPEEP